ncbi:MAG: tetratricopeptide repeat protein, partial [Chloroflexi bacterium]|nr:tetratricopeptide repeat protein [Chloroflexota bacterium]
LAIELASARVGTLGVDEVAKRLEESFGLLDGAHHGIVERHQTLQALIGWSYDLLSDEERRLLEHVSVFVGSWTLAAAESVGEVSGSRIPELLSRLVDKSLVTVVEQNGQVRYRLLEMVRQYANEKLHRCGDFERTRKLHLEWCLQLVQEAEPRLRSSARPVWMQRLEAENDNLRAGLEWSLRPDETDEEVMEKGLLLAGTLTPFWVTSGNLREGSTWLGQAIEKRRAREHRGTPGCAKALCGGALLALFEREWLRVAELCETGIPIARSLGDRGLTSLLLFLLGEYQLNHAHDLVKGYGLLEESVELAKQVGDPWQASASLFTLGSLIQFERDPERAAHLFEEGMALARRAGDPWLIGTLLDYYGEQEQSRGDYTRAAALYHESLAARRRLKDKGGMAGTLNNLGRLARHQGDLTRAAEFYRQSLELFSDLGLVEYVAIVKHNLACVSLQRGDDVLAASQFKESLGLFREIERKEGVAKCLMGLAVSERTSPNVGTRVQYFAAAQAYLEISQASLSTLFDVDDIDSAPLSSAARETMGDQAFETAMAEGRSLSLEEVLTNTRSQL